MADTPHSKSGLIGLYLRNFAANLAGNLTIVLLNLFTPLEVFKDWQAFLRQGGWIFLVIALPLIFSTAIVLQYLIQRPIAVFYKQITAGQKIDVALQQRARKRLLNLPLTLGMANFALWIFATALVVPIIYYAREFYLNDFGAATGLYLFFRTIILGLMAAFISFFLVDDYARSKLIPLLFPEGKLAATPGTVKISILRRIRVLYGAGTGAPVLILVGSLGLVLWEMEDTQISAVDFGQEIFIFIIVLYIVFVPLAVSLNYLVGKSILRPVKDMMHLVKKVRHGDFKHQIQVVSNDELGVLADGMNEMTEGLIERDRMRQSLFLAKEVQQALLPRETPRIRGLDIAATSVYCDETGGDYFDYLGRDGPDSGKISIVVGDVSGHGVPSALLMATARAFLRQRSDLPGSICQIVSDVNRQLARDVAESGGFMTLFYLTIDAKNRSLSWVRAGHDPAIFYDPASDTFEELHGTGVALGVQADVRFAANEKNDLQSHQIIFLGTDGIWEARNPRGEMFGKDEIQRIIRQNHAAGAKEILTICFNTLSRFSADRAPEDDVTMIVIKLMDD
jgi:sigma-B regulation protein RsbU (phosphoserine phosphatase)